MTDQQALTQYTQHKDAHAFHHIINIYYRLVYSAAHLGNANDDRAISHI